MTKREPWIVVVLTFVTCGVYMLWWNYQTTEELRTASGRQDLNPVMDLILTFVSCSLWAMWVGYRNTQVVHEMYAARGVAHEDRSTLVLLLYVAGVVTGGVSSFLAPMIVQDEYNKLTDRLLGAGAAPGGNLPAAF